MSDAEEKQDRARELRISGWSFPQIAESADPTAPDGELRPLYSSPEMARRAVLAANRRHAGEFVEDEKVVGITAGERRTLIGDQLMEMVKAWHPLAMGGDDKAAKIVRDCLRDYAALYGLTLKAAAAPAESKPPGGQPKEDPADEVARKRARRLAGNGGPAPADPPPPE
jgi:hypothetical protein